MMYVFPITSGESDENIDEILGYQVLDAKGVVLAKGETEEEAREKALLTMFLTESNEDKSRKIKLDPKLFRKKMVQRC
jgi:hypothetical protein